jgi:hypothetical protein
MQRAVNPVLFSRVACPDRACRSATRARPLTLFSPRISTSREIHRRDPDLINKSHPERWNSAELKNRLRPHPHFTSNPIIMRKNPQIRAPWCAHANIWQQDIPATSNKTPA